MLECASGAVAGRETITCDSSNKLVSVVCSFDGGKSEECSLPLVLGINRFGTDNHTVVVTVVDEFGQSLSLTFDFRLIQRELHYFL